MEDHPNYCVRYPLANLVIRASMSFPAREMLNNFGLSSPQGIKSRKRQVLTGRGKEIKSINFVERLEQIRGWRTTRKFDEMLMI